MILSPERKGEIALLELKQQVLEGGIKISKETPRDIKNRAKKLNIPEDEAFVFAEEIARFVMDSVFPPKKA